MSLKATENAANLNVSTRTMHGILLRLVVLLQVKSVLLLYRRRRNLESFVSFLSILDKGVITKEQYDTLLSANT